MGLESSCDESAAAVVTDDGRVLAQALLSQADLHARWGGVVPEVASREHLLAMSWLTDRVLSQAGLGIRQVDGIAVTCQPGLVGALLVGVQFAKALAWASRRPIVGVDHLVGHLLSVFLREADSAPTLQLPYVALLVSGGHSALYRVDSLVSDGIHLLGATRDDAAGEAFDKVAKLLGLGYPGGPAIERLAKAGDPSQVRFSVPMLRQTNLEFSFSGLKTQVAQWVELHPIQNPADLANVCASLQSAIVDSLVHKLVRAARREGVQKAVIVGGVAANRTLVERARTELATMGVELASPRPNHCTDNAAMIAFAGAQDLLRGRTDSWNLEATPVSRISSGVRGRQARGST